MAKNRTTAVAVKEEVSEADIALCLSQRYADAAKTITERTVVFGATLMQAEAELQKRGLLVTGRGNEGGLQRWIEKHCPEINYKTAMRWKGLAFQMAQGLMSKDKKATLKIEDIIKLIEGRDDEIEAEVPKAITKQRDELMAAPTVRKFVQQMFDFAGGKAKGKAGRPSSGGKGGTKFAQTAEQRVAEAENQTRELMGKIGAYFMGQWFEKCSQQTKNDFIKCLKDWADVAAERM